MGLFVDGDGLPLAFSLFPGNQNEQKFLKPLENKVYSQFGHDTFFTVALPAWAPNTTKPSTIWGTAPLLLPSPSRSSRSKNAHGLLTVPVLKGFPMIHLWISQSWRKRRKKKEFIIRMSPIQQKTSPAADCHLFLQLCEGRLKPVSGS